MDPLGSDDCIPPLANPNMTADRDRLSRSVQFLNWSCNNTLRMAEQYQARVEEYDNALANSLLKGKERKLVRQRRFRAKKSLEQTRQDLDAILSALNETRTQLEALSITSYLPPVLMYPPTPLFTPEGIICPYPTSPFLPQIYSSPKNLEYPIYISNPTKSWIDLSSQIDSNFPTYETRDLNLEMIDNGNSEEKNSHVD